MTLLVTGAMGHVGYEIVRNLARSRPVIAQYHRTFRQADADALGAHATWVACDLTDLQAVERLCREHGVDSCIHLAAMANEMYCRPDPVAAFQANVGAVVNLLDVARRHEWRRMIYGSTGSVFKNVDPAMPIMEDLPPDADGLYGTTKACGEIMVRAFRAQFGVDAATVRISWIYGPPVVNYTFARGPIPPILIDALRGVERNDASGGNFSAGFTYIDDVVEGLIAAVDAPRLNHAIYHLAPLHNYAVFEVAEAVKSAVPGAVIAIGPGAMPWSTYTPIRGPMDGSRFIADTGFRTRFDLRRGIGAYAAWLQAEPGRLDSAGL
ncbi:NAD-dependent epimerase/dehydratase family protein [Chelatococcus sp. GCM10030263]|uniref:NAD-dependent epimerase/dehydratase family protein n=1 Tax=Chelatococcus sp. GCM10030263 TaxID=3273387 RepID=UPI003615C89B